MKRRRSSTWKRVHPGLLLSVALTSGCASSGAAAKSTQPRIPVKSDWTNTAQGVVTGTPPDLMRWWEQLGDATLSDVIGRATRNNPDLHTAQARLRQARAQRGIQQADLWPSVSGSPSVSERKGTGTTLSASIDASWEPDVFGGTRHAIEGATADVRATAADLYATQVSLVAEVALDYGQLRTLQTRLDIARKNADSQAETLELTSFRAQAGLVGSLDVERARANLEQTRAQIPTLETSIAQTIHRIARLAGLEPTALNGELTPAGALPKIPSQIVVGIPADTLRQRPDLRSAEQRIVAETARLAQAGTRRYPQFSLSGSIGTEILKSSTDVATGIATGGAALVSSLAVSALRTIFDAGRIRQRIAVQSAVQEQAISSYDATLLGALEDVENALVSFENTRQRLERLDAAQRAANDAALLARSQYTSGLTDFQTVLDTERTALTVQDSIASSEGDRLTALVQLYKSLGGGWTPAATDTSISGTAQK